MNQAKEFRAVFGHEEITVFIRDADGVWWRRRLPLETPVIRVIEEALATGVYARPGSSWEQAVPLS